VGVGAMGQHHVRIVSETPDVILAGLHDPDPGRAEEICRRHGCKSFTTLEELLDGSNAVAVAAPTSLHSEIGEQCLKRGIHVLMEKPLAHSPAAAARLVDLAREADAVLMVGHIERYNPAIGKLFEVLTAEEDEIISMDFRRLAPFDGSRCLDVDVLHDLLIHDIDLALEIANSPISKVSATGRQVFSQQLDVAHTRIEFQNGSVAVFWTAKCSPKKMRTITVATNRRYISADTLNRTLTVDRADKIPSAEDGTCFMADIRAEEIPVPDEEPLRRELEAFFRAVREGASPLVDGLRGLQGLEALELVARSIRGEL